MDKYYARGNGARSGVNELVNTQQRIPVLICVDRSGSMTKKFDGTYENRLDLAYKCIVEDFIKDVMATPTLKYSVRLAVITFGNDAKVVKEFDEILNEQSNRKIARVRSTDGSESGDLLLGVQEAFRLIHEEKNYIDNILKTSRKAPWLIIMSDGRPSRTGPGTKVVNYPEYKAMAQELLELDKKDKINIIPVFFDDEDNEKIREDGYKYMNNLTNTYRNKIAVVDPTKKADFTKFFRILSSSLKAGNHSKQYLSNEMSKNYSSTNVEASKEIEDLPPIDLPEPINETKPSQAPAVEERREEAKPLPPVFHILINDEEIQLQPISKEEHLAAYTFTNSEAGGVLVIEREGLGALKFNDTGTRSYVLDKAPCRYKIFITVTNTILIVEEDFPSARKPVEEDIEESSNEDSDVESNDEDLIDYEYFDDIIDALK